MRGFLSENRLERLRAGHALGKKRNDTPGMADNEVNVELPPQEECAISSSTVDAWGVKKDVNRGERRCLDAKKRGRLQLKRAQKVVRAVSGIISEKRPRAWERGRFPGRNYRRTQTNVAQRRGAKLLYTHGKTYF